jgi:periplasmic copper chaperone A
MNIASRLFPVLFLAAANAAFAAGAADSVGVVDPYVRLMPPGARTTAAFMVLRNAGDKAARLVKAESAAAKTVELHTHLNEGGMMMMRQVPAIEIKAKGETALKPGGYHVMLIEPVAMHEGDKVAITLGFDDGRSKKIEATVKSPEAEPAAMDHSGDDHMHMQ